MRELIPSVRELGEGMRELDETFTVPSLLESVLAPRTGNKLLIFFRLSLLILKIIIEVKVTNK